jgi:L-glyceraldehyde 3-phosphate reductase
MMMAQLVLAWTLRDKRVTSALIGASRPQQIIDNVKMIENLSFSSDELDVIEKILGQ